MEPVRIEFLMVDKLSGRLDQATGKMEQLTGQTSQARERMEELDRSGLSVQKTLGRLASAFALKELVGKITAVRGEFQQLEVAFETMLGSAEKADALLGQLTRTAATTPFGLEDVAQGAKQLLAYGFEAEKVNETLVRLGDIAAGLSVPLNDLVYLYGTTMAQGRLYTQDLNQFTGRGIPMISELAKQFGVAESKVKELVEAGKVGFPEVQKVIESLTDEGGKFGGLMEAQSKTISGQISNIEDALSMMFNELGQRSEGIINKTLSGVSYMVEHYEQFGRILLGLVGTYGVYRTAVMAVTAAKGFATAAEMVHYNRLLLVEKAQKALNATMLSNPYVLVATAVAGVAAAMMSMKSEAERLKDAEEGYEAQKQKVIEAEEEHRRKMDELCSIAGDEAVSTDTRREALNKLEQKYPDIFAMYDTEYEKLKNIKKIKEEIALQDGQKSITKTENELERVEKRIKALEGKTRTATEHYQDGYGKWTTRYVTKSARTKDEEAELKNLYAKRKQLSGQIRKDEVNAYFENLTGVSNETLEAQIKQRENLLAKMALNENKYGKISYGDAALTGTYSRDELQYQLNKLKSEQNLRNKPTDSSSEWVATAKKTYEDALKAYNDFIQDTENKLTQEDFEKQAKALKDAVDVAKKEYDKVKPGENKDAEKEKKAREKAETEAERAHKRQLEAERRRVKELDKLRRDNEQTSIDQMADGSAKRIRQIKLDYDKEVAEIQEQEAKWREAHKGNPGAEQSDAWKDAYAQAQANMEAKVRGVEQDEVEKGKKKMNALLEQYKDYDRKRRDIDAAYAADMENLKDELARRQENGSDTGDVEGSIRARRDAYRQEIEELQGEILQSSEFFDKLFADTSEKGYKVLKDFYEQAKEVLEKGKVGSDGVEVSVPYKDADGKFVQKSVKVTVAEFRKMKKQVNSIRKDLEKNNPFAAFRGAWGDLKNAMKNDGDVSGALKNLNAKGKEMMQTIRGWGESLGAVFGERFSKSMDEMMTFCEGVQDLGTGIAQIWTGDIVGGITSTLSGLGSIVAMFKSWKEKMEEMKREWYIAEIETNRIIRERGEAYAADRSQISDIIKDVETLNWLVKKGYAKPTSVSVWEAQSAALEKYMKDLDAEAAANDALWEKVQGSTGYYEWGNSLNGGSNEWSLRGYSKEQIELLYNQNKLSKEARDYYEAWVESGKSVEELNQHIVECMDSMREMVMGVSFDSFLSSSRDVLKQMRSDISALGEFTEETLSEAILNAFMYQELAKDLEPLYNDLSEHLINGTADKEYLENWRRTYEETMTAANARLDAISEATGVDISDDKGTSQSAKAGGFQAMTQDQGSKLEGMFTSGLQHWSSMDEKMENVSEKMNAAENHLAKIEENTGKSAEQLEKIAENMVVILRDGLKVK